MRDDGWSWITCLLLSLLAGVASAQTTPTEALAQRPSVPVSPTTGAAGAAATPAASGVTLQQHPWGRFCPGAWKHVRVTTEVLDAQGQVTHSSVTETKTTLMEVAESEVTLLAEVAVEVSGKRIQSEPQTLKQEIHGELLVKGLQVKHLGEGSVTLEGVKVPCEIDQVEVVGPHTRTVTRLFTSSRRMPYLLRRESVTTSLEDQQPLSRTEMEVLAVDMPAHAVDITVPAAFVRIVHHHSSGTIVTLAVTSPEVPGGVVSHSSKELDTQGAVVRRSTLELVDFNYRPDEAAESDRGILGRRRGLRPRKPLFHSNE